MMKKWNKFSYKGKVYSLEHLHPFEFKFLQKATKGKEEKEYIFEVYFSNHCFTRGIEKEEAVDKDLLFKTQKETRIISFGRYELSKNLPKIIKDLENRKCYHTNHFSFFTVEIIDENNNKIDYEIYFDVKKVKKNRLKLYVRSAYVRTESYQCGQPKRKKAIKFEIIAYNTFVKKPIKPAQ